MNPVSLSKSSLRWLTQRVIEDIRIAGLSYRDVMQQYSPTPLARAVLPPVVDVFKRRFFTVEVNRRVTSVEACHRLYLKGLRRLAVGQWSSELASEVNKLFVRPIIPMEAELPEMFATRFAFHMAESPTTLILSPNSAFTRCREAGYVGVFGIFNGTLEGNRCDDSLGYRWLTGVPKYDGTWETFDVLDKLAMCELPLSTHSAITLIKCHSGPQAAYDIEQALYNAPEVGVQASSLDNLKYSKDMWKTIEMVWAQADRPLDDKLTELYDTLVPEYMSDAYYSAIFPTDAGSLNRVYQIERGLLKVKSLFQEHWHE